MKPYLLILFLVINLSISRQVNASGFFGDVGSFVDGLVDAVLGDTPSNKAEDLKNKEKQLKTKLDKREIPKDNQVADKLIIYLLEDLMYIVIKNFDTLKLTSIDKDIMVKIEKLADKIDQLTKNKEDKQLTKTVIDLSKEFYDFIVDDNRISKLNPEYQQKIKKIATEITQLKAKIASNTTNISSNTCQKPFKKRI